MWNWKKTSSDEQQDSFQEPQVSLGVQLIHEHVQQFVVEMNDILPELPFPQSFKPIHHTASFEHSSHGVFHKIVEHGQTSHFIDLGPTTPSRVKAVHAYITPGSPKHTILLIEACDGVLNDTGLHINRYRVFSDGKIEVYKKNKFSPFDLNVPTNVTRLEQFLLNLRLRIDAKSHYLKSQEDTVVDLAINFNVGNRGY